MEKGGLRTVLSRASMPPISAPRFSLVANARTSSNRSTVVKRQSDRQPIVPNPASGKTSWRSPRSTRVFQRRAEVRDPEAVGAGIPGERGRLPKRHVPVAHGFGRVLVAPVGPFADQEIDASRNPAVRYRARIRDIRDGEPSREAQAPRQESQPTIPRDGLTNCSWLQRSIGTPSARARSGRKALPRTRSTR